MSAVAPGSADLPVTISSVVEKSLLSLHSAISVLAFWRAVQRVINAALPGSLIGMTLQHNPIHPMLVKWTREIREGFFDSKPLTKYLNAHPRTRFVHSSDLFPRRRNFVKSDFFRKYMAPQKCVHAIGLLFWRGQRLISVIVIMRTAKQGEFTVPQMKLLRRLYPHFHAALRRLSSLEREHAARAAFEEFLKRLPLPTILLRWNLKLIYQNQAAREFCALWQRGPQAARILKADAPVPREILDGCRELKSRWRQDRQSPPLKAPVGSAWKTVVHHPGLPHLRATLSLRQIASVGVTRPHFFIECEELQRSPQKRGLSPLPHLAQLTRREQQMTRLVCEGRSNQEIADEAMLSLAVVKKYLHSIFGKLEVNSRSQLIALMR
jgi:DNA-binding CsgD family transcriptional regulator